MLFSYMVERIGSRETSERPNAHVCKYTASTQVNRCMRFVRIIRSNYRNAVEAKLKFANSVKRIVWLPEFFSIECNYKRFYTHSRSLRYTYGMSEEMCLNMYKRMNVEVSERKKEKFMGALSSHDYKIWKTCAPINAAKMNEHKMPSETAAILTKRKNNKKKQNRKNAHIQQQHKQWWTHDVTATIHKQNDKLRGRWNTHTLTHTKKRDASKQTMCVHERACIFHPQNNDMLLKVKRIQHWYDYASQQFTIKENEII